MFKEELDCLLNFLRVSLLGFLSFCLSLFMILFFTLSGVFILYGGSVKFAQFMK